MVYNVIYFLKNTQKGLAEASTSKQSKPEGEACEQSYEYELIGVTVHTGENTIIDDSFSDRLMMVLLMMNDSDTNDMIVVMLLMIK